MTDTKPHDFCDCSPKEECSCAKCTCPRCKSVTEEDCACCKHECACCGHDEFIEQCDCADDCQCAPGYCKCGHGPCICGCRGGVREPGCRCSCHGECRCGEEEAQPVDESVHEGARLSVSPVTRRPMLPLNSPGGVALAVMIVAELGLKAAAITKAVRRGDKKWILPLVVINTAGVLPTYYLVSRRGKK